ncbi:MULTISPECIES: SDR family NAD(P)-dependent oxidoreductase [Paraburkholderia]|uniref:SDR family NAD(P)-dependent oxidoreductase n=1 Tax=Paraburkholderia TaxID=1822464 RepID=UPI00225BEBF2|nr:MULTISPECIES: SDR family NAD(P)-dependent oxidoreductase [Paraburkholderia]MCX4166261.1 SDR family NAD(P)-dependent oxidoreductase [Paraburkholderia megapolitana]MDN7161751.1 SDR family NAD(P)-dependent oxidoreductase [Paraburkholderia sp. CHISQ3]MDQ6498799.1 SDR family NAD(P)-dependent oxidoreductase [Paraburkholderia megapolitana]
MSRSSAIVVGVGAEVGLGAALCKRIAREGYHVYVAGRSPAKLTQVVEAIVDAGGTAEAVVADTTQEADVFALFDKAMTPRHDIAPPDLIVYNAGNNRYVPFTELSAADFESFWRIGPLGAFLVGREVARRIAPSGGGTLIFTGASASLRGKPGFAHFASSKAGVRMIAQSMAREFGPQGLHVAHVVVDGGIDGERLRQARPGVIAERGENGLLNIDAIADMYWTLHRQHPSAWTQEVDLRPFKETF